MQCSVMNVYQRHFDKVSDIEKLGSSAVKNRCNLRTAAMHVLMGEQCFCYRDNSLIYNLFFIIIAFLFRSI